MEDISRSERETDCSSLENYVTTVSGGVAIRSRCFGTQAIRLGRKDPYPRFAGSFHRLERYANCKREKGQVSIPNVCVVRNLPFFLLPSSLFFPCLKVILLELSFFLGGRLLPSLTTLAKLKKSDEEGSNVR